MRASGADHRQMDLKEHLHGYLKTRRTDLLSKLDGLSEYDVRRPMTSTGTNLLGLVKHVASVEVGYFGEVFGRPFPAALPWFDAERDADFWAPPEQRCADIIALHHACAVHSDATIEALPLDAPGVVPWWLDERRKTTLGQLLVHMLAETSRHAGHADIIREQIDGAIGMRPSDPNVGSVTADDWAVHRARLEAAARAAAEAPEH